MSSNNANRNQKLADLIAKMSRKISQLTRVVFILNTKNDEHDSLIDTICQAYEKELQNIMKEGNNAIKKMKQQIENIKIQNNPETKIQEINDKFTKKVNNFSHEIDKYKNSLKSKQKKIEDEYSIKYDKMIKENIEIKKLYDSKINDLYKRIEDEKKNFN